MLPFSGFSFSSNIASLFMHNHRSATSVPFGDTFLLVGGYCDELCDHRALRTILEYDADSEMFVRRGQKLDVGVYAAAAVFLPGT